MELYVMDMDFKILGIVDDYISLTWGKKFRSYGKVVFQVVANIKYAQLLVEGNVIIKDFETDKPEGAYIDGLQFKKDRYGNSILIVTAYTLERYLDRRIITKTLDATNTEVEAIIRRIINENAISCESNRMLPKLQLGALLGGTERISCQYTYKTMLEVAEELTGQCKLGFEMGLSFSNKKFIFNVLRGTNRTAGQKIVPPCVFSESFENIDNAEYLRDMTDYKNVVLVAGADSGEARQKVVINDSIAGFSRRELFVDARDVQPYRYVNSDRVEIEEAEYLDLLRERGKARSAKFSETTMFDCGTNDEKGRFGRQYKLGDTVTMMVEEWDKCVDVEVLEIEEVREKGVRYLYPRFGIGALTLMDKIKREVG